MKIKKFEAIVEANPWLWSYLGRVRRIYGLDHRYPSRLKELRDWVRRNISYVAFRPWESLTFLEHKEVLSNQKLGEGHQVISMVEYEILWHSDKTRPFSERESFVPGERTPSTIGQIIGHIVQYRLDYPTDLQAIFIDAVVKHRYTYSTLYRDYTGESFEVYICPENWAMSWMKEDLELHRRLKSKNLRVQGVPMAS